MVLQIRVKGSEGNAPAFLGKQAGDLDAQLMLWNDMSSVAYKQIILPALCGVLPLCCITACEWLVVSPYGSETLLWLELFFALGALVAVPLFLASLIGLGLARYRKLAVTICLCCLSYVPAFIISIRLGERIRMDAFHRLAERSKPLIAAIQAYEKKHGNPPKSLETLVPEFIPAVPRTGMRAYPEYEYSCPATNYSGNPWVVTVFTPSGGINFDQFMYFPLTNYPRKGYGGSLEMVGDWAYVHE